MKDLFKLRRLFRFPTYLVYLCVFYAKYLLRAVFKVLEAKFYAIPISLKVSNPNAKFDDKNVIINLKTASRETKNKGFLLG